MDLHSVDISHECNHTILCDWFLSLSIMFPRFINCGIMYQDLIPFYGHRIVLCTHIHFICSYTDGHLGCSYLLAVVNSVSVNVHIQVFECLPSILLCFSFAFPLQFSFSATNSLEWMLDGLMIIYQSELIAGPKRKGGEIGIFLPRAKLFRTFGKRPGNEWASSEHAQHRLWHTVGSQ